MPSTKPKEPTASVVSSLSDKPHIFQGIAHCPRCAETARQKAAETDPVPLSEAPLYDAAKRAHEEKQAAFQAVQERALEDAPSHDQAKEELGRLLDARDASYGEPPLTSEEEERAPEDACGRCKGSAIDPEDSSSGAIYGDYPEPPALEPCRACQFPTQPVRRPPYAVAYSVDGHLYEVALPGDATVTAVDGALVIKHTPGQVAGIVGIQPITAKAAS